MFYGNWLKGHNHYKLSLQNGLDTTALVCIRAEGESWKKASVKFVIFWCFRWFCGTCLEFNYCCLKLCNVHRFELLAGESESKINIYDCIHAMWKYGRKAFLLLLRFLLAGIKVSARLTFKSSCLLLKWLRKTLKRFLYVKVTRVRINAFHALLRLSRNR